MRITCTKEDAKRNHYVPLPIGNGDLSLQIDYAGAQRQEKFCGMIPGIRRTGYRYDSAIQPTPRGFIPLGFFDQDIAGAGELSDWTQTIDIGRGVIECRTVYADGLVMDSVVFCHYARNVIAVHKRLSQPRRYAFRYHLAARRLRVTPQRDLELRCEFDLDRPKDDRVVVSSDQDGFRAKAGDGVYALEGALSEGTFFITFNDDRHESWAELLADHCGRWQQYWAESYVRLPDKRIEATYYSSQYHLKISSTRWSMPIGLFDTHWSGRFFAFDAYFMVTGLLSSGRLDEVAKITRFNASLLQRALMRSAPSHHNDGSALFNWMDCEDGGEGAGPGHWLDHIFHHANIALTCYDYCRYSNDHEFLAGDGYALIRACAMMYLRRMIYRNVGGKTIVGKCCDLERLGPNRENAFMTTCSAIATLQCAADTAAALGRDAELVAEWREVAAELRRDLPREGNRYVAYPGSPTASIGTLAGYYPYPVLAPDDPAAVAALDFFNANESKVGNMYTTGQSICAWYRCWKAMAYLRSDRPQDALEQVTALANETGCFSEVFEIYEKGMRPWFATAEGAFIDVVNRLLLPNDKGQIPAHRCGWHDVEYRLMLPGKKWVTHP
ncbi:MAG: hypothetical protein PHT80_00715 [Lentisphaeria bacterium]|nr:hypothetical protein [Lentisphaeria bacterium]